MSRSSKPNWEAHSLGAGLWNVLDANGSGRAYRVTFSQGGRIVSVYNVTNGKVRALDPDGRAAKELANVAKERMRGGQR